MAKKRTQQFIVGHKNIILNLKKKKMTARHKRMLIIDNWQKNITQSM